MLLQLLGEQHAPLVKLLGKSSGRDMDKMALLKGIMEEEPMKLNGCVHS